MLLATWLPWWWCGCMCAVLVRVRSAGPYTGWQKEIEYFELCERLAKKGATILGGFPSRRNGRSCHVTTSLGYGCSALVQNGC